jgi:aminopeptidase N
MSTMRNIRPAVLSFLTVFLLTASASLKAQNRDISYMSSGGQLKPLQAIMDIRHYTLVLDVDIPGQAIEGYVEIDLNLSQPTDTLLFDLVHFLTVSQVESGKLKQSFVQKGDSVLITGKNRFAAGKQVIRISYGGKPPVAVRPPWKGGFTWTKDRSNNPWVVINCQLEGGKVYFPCKDHPSDEPNEGVDLFITIPKGLSVAGPGLLQSVKDLKNKSTWHWKTQYTISNYCVVFNIGKYEVVRRPYTTIEGHTVPIEFYVLAEDLAHAEKVIDIRQRDTRIMEKYFGEYPWVKEKIGIAQVPNPGMEHQTMITYGDRFTYEQYPGVDYSANLLHEFAHEWWANKITNKDWAHMWIQEGFATYAEALFFKEALGENSYDSLMLRFKLAIRNEKPVVQGEGLNMAQVYNGDIYHKGAFLLHTLRFVMSDSVFFPALRKFITDLKYPYDRFFTTADIQKFFCDASGKDLNPLFDFYLRTNKTLDFELHKTGPETYQLKTLNSPVTLPLDILTDQGIIKTAVNTEDQKSFRINSKTQPVIDPKGYYFKKVTIY